MPPHEGDRRPLDAGGTEGGAGPRPRQAGSPAGLPGMTVHISKLRGIDRATRNKLKRHRISYSHQLLRRGLDAQDRAQLGRQLDLTPGALDDLLARADLARIRGIGAIFADMLRMVGLNTAGVLAREEADVLHARLKALNDVERLARRAPTSDEVRDWIEQAKAFA